MDTITSCHSRIKRSSASAIIPVSQPRAVNYSVSIPLASYPFLYLLKKYHVLTAKKKSSDSEPILKPSIVEEVSMNDDEEDGLFFEDLEDGFASTLLRRAQSLGLPYVDHLVNGEEGRSLIETYIDYPMKKYVGHELSFNNMNVGSGFRLFDIKKELDEDDDYLDDEYIEEEPLVGDGSGGGGVSLTGTRWDKTALAIAEEVALSFDGELGIYAFRTLLNSTIQVRIERLTNKSGSPSMMDIEDFTSAYRELLDEAEVAGSIPDNITLEVSSPGVERVVRIPDDLERFKERPMFVKYVRGVTESGSTSEHGGIFRLVSYNLERKSCTWGLADVRVNREKAGKGRPLSKKLREWRLETTFDSLLLVRFYSEI